MVAAFTVHSRLSDDLFLEFRAWPILHGKKDFIMALSSPDHVATLVSRAEVDDIDCGGFPELATKLWLDRGGDIKLYAKSVGFIQTPTIKQPWPQSRHEFKERYPMLYKAFWNPGRIKALNG